MSVALEIFSELSRRGITVRVEGETIRLKPKSALDDGLVGRIREHKPELLAALRRRRPIMCIHCRGQNRCECVRCMDAFDGTPDRAGECAACRGTGKALTWVH